jgi:hypothetical protein
MIDRDLVIQERKESTAQLNKINRCIKNIIVLDDYLPT